MLMYSTLLPLAYASNNNTSQFHFLLACLLEILIVYSKSNI